MSNNITKDTTSSLDQERLNKNNNHAENDWEDEDEEDEWGTHELDIEQLNVSEKTDDNSYDNIIHSSNSKEEQDNNDEYWNNNEDNDTEKKIQTDKSIEKINDNDNDGEPMHLLDITKINPNIHSKYDRNSVNDPTAASKIRRQIEREYFDLEAAATTTMDGNKKTNLSSLIADGTIVPCGTSVWKDALSRMRDERKGHYFVPIFCVQKPS